MNQPITGHHYSDDDGNPAGGYTTGIGFSISWQNGPLGRGENRVAPTGAFVEGVIAAAKDRLEYYQSTKFACQENADAIEALEQALYVLNARTADREFRGVEGTHDL